MIKKKLWITGFYMGERTQEEIDKLKEAIEKDNTCFFVDGKTDFLVCRYD